MSGWQWAAGRGRGELAPGCSSVDYSRSSFPVVSAAMFKVCCTPLPGRDVHLSLVPRVYYYRLNQGSVLKETNTHHKGTNEITLMHLAL